MLRILLMVLRNIWRVPGAWFKLCRNAKHTERNPEQEKYDHIRYIMNLAVKSGNIDLIVTGQQKLPEQNGFILYGNHQGMFDVVALVATFPRILGAVVKKELANNPFLKQIYASTKSYPMDREDVRQSLTVIQKVTEEVKQGRNYLIFPEGTRSKKGNVMGDFHGGSFRCAVKAKCPIVPVAFIDSFKVLDQKGCKKVGVQIHFLEPIPFEEYGHLKTVDVAQLVKDRIRQAIDENIG